MRDEALAERIQQHTWFHSFDFGDGLVAKGVKSLELLSSEWDSLQLPDLRGRSVLDIGAWDGWFSYRAEAQGASRVVAVDHYAWAMDNDAQAEYWNRCHREGVPPEAYDRVPDLWDTKRLPGRRGFDIAHDVLSSRVEAVLADIPDISRDALGSFDVVLFLGVLYHLENPLLALRRLVDVTTEFCVIETVCLVLPGHEDHALWELFGADELDGDPSNWWAGNAKGIESMCLAAGFREVEFLARPSETAIPAPGYDYHYGRARLRAYR